MAELDDAIAAAVSSAEAQAAGNDDGSAGTDSGGEVGSGQEVAPEPAAAEPKAAAPTPEPEPEPEDDEPLVPSAADLEAINANPQLLKVYKSMQRGLTQKTTKLATERKALAERAKVADWIQSNPDNAIRALAQARGLTIAEAKAEVKAAQEDVADALGAKFEKALGKDAAAILRPLIEETAAAIAQKQMSPIAERAEALSKAAAERGLAAAVREFESTVIARGEDFPDDVQEEMAALMNTVAPAEHEDENGNIVQASVDEYLSALHDMVMMRRSRKGAIQAQLKRLKETKAAGTEPSTTGAKPAADEDTVPLGLSDNDAVARAVAIAERKMQKGRR